MNFYTIKSCIHSNFQMDSNPKSTAASSFSFLFIYLFKFLERSSSI